jgi:hypothetical protein
MFETSRTRTGRFIDSFGLTKAWSAGDIRDSKPCQMVLAARSKDLAALALVFESLSGFAVIGLRTPLRIRGAGYTPPLSEAAIKPKRYFIHGRCSIAPSAGGFQIFLNYLNFSPSCGFRTHTRLGFGSLFGTFGKNKNLLKTHIFNID